MKIIDVPVYNEDGSLQFTQSVSPQEAQALLQFAINFNLAVGMSSGVSIGTAEDEDVEFDD